MPMKNAVLRCPCGKRRSKYSEVCRDCYAESSRKAKEQARRIVADGKCPMCGAGLRRNLSLTGWWQCEQSGAEGFRKDAAKPPCSFQTFTE